MAYVATPAEKAQKLRLLESAAAVAIGYGASPEEVLRTVQAGIDSEQQLQARRAAAQAGRPLPEDGEVTSQPRAATPALDAWAAQVHA